MNDLPPRPATPVPVVLQPATNSQIIVLNRRIASQLARIQELEGQVLELNSAIRAHSSWLVSFYCFFLLLY